MPTSHLGRFIPRATEIEYREIEQECLRLGVALEARDSKRGGRAYRVRKDEMRKLPVDGGSPFLSAGQDAGYGLCSAIMLDDDCFDYAGDWYLVKERGCAS